MDTFCGATIHTEYIFTMPLRECVGYLSGMMAWHNVNIPSHAYYDTFWHINAIHKSKSRYECKKVVQGVTYFTSWKMQAPNTTHPPKRWWDIVYELLQGGSFRGIVGNSIKVYIKL